jgi:UDPglucose--hexose-1-phosphate uridylyltransferase
MAKFFDKPHRRLNPLTGEWVLVSPHRAKRPWQGQQESLPAESRPAYDPTCYLCPGNERVGGVRNPDYTGTYVFTNDFPSLLPDIAEEELDDGLLQARSERGTSRVICFSPRHDLTLAAMNVDEIARVVDTWTEQFTELSQHPDIQHVQIFENRGEMMGCSNAHPHCQIWAQSALPNEVVKELDSQAAYYRRHGRTLLADYLARERQLGTRLVFDNGAFAALIPFWAVWPFETLLISEPAVSGLDQLDHAERRALAEALQQLTAGYDRLFNVSFPYSMGFHQRPTDGQPHPEWHLHAHFHPPLLRSATVKKFMVGYEFLAMPQRDLTAETAAARLRDCIAA